MNLLSHSSYLIEDVKPYFLSVDVIIVEWFRFCNREAAVPFFGPNIACHVGTLQ